MTTPREHSDPTGGRVVTDEEMAALLPTTKAYTAVILKVGPNRHSDGADAIVWEHGRRNFALRAEGLLSIVCPIADGTQIAGVGIFALDPEQTAAVMSGDPAVQAGVLQFEVHPCRSFPGDALPG